MKKQYILLLGLVSVLIFSCEEKDMLPEVENELYFPPSHTDEWQSTAPNTLGWSQEALENLYTYLEENQTRAFIILKDGKIVVEKYWGNNFLNTGVFEASSMWYWASAGKTLTATLIGAAEKEGFLSIGDRTSDYLGTGWTSFSPEKEDLITIKHQLTMSTGLNYQVSDLDCTAPSCLEYGKDAGTQWYYHNAAYTLLEKVVNKASGIDYNTFTDQKIEAITGMDGRWVPLGYNNVYWSTARDMARFGLLTLNKGIWEANQAVYTEGYYEQMVNSSQELNPSYGYLWWLNGKSKIIFPGLPTSFNRDLSVYAPDDLIAGMGKNGQFVEIVPEQNLVVVRMGEAPNDALVPISFHDEMWEKLHLVISF
ncbi:MAG: beta-lactamase family protein [Cytophagales bacterium]|uniref:serine hydrolase domain-containing protein n=1 Tax=Cyclobacterium marinum TaxID=104 RepID=UPI0030DB1F73|nr:beta-lactamase family protein [Cytophagales bacterium]|tara:strand:- start:43010 stop:44110 length:1101 start_codon:yes stop_codon:yes gene_type:complete